VEQKNFTAVRNFVGYSRYDSPEELELLNELYSYLRLYLNFFHPQMKLVRKERIGARVKKQYDLPQTPCQRLITMDEISADKKKKLQATYEQLNPFALKRSIDKLQVKLQKTVYEERKGRPAYVINCIKPVLE
jgi:hypothetical protein